MDYSDNSLMNNMDFPNNDGYTNMDRSENNGNQSNYYNDNNSNHTNTYNHRMFEMYMMLFVVLLFLRKPLLYHKLDLGIVLALYNKL